jgi:O-antigen/teichoic acid export membrane protein
VHDGTQRRVVRGTAAYLLTAALQRGVSFLLLPVFAHALSPAEFGQIGIVTTVSGAVAAVLGLGLESAVFRTLVQLRSHPDEARRFVNSVGLFGIAAPALGGVALAIPVGLAIDSTFSVPMPIVALGVVAGVVSVSTTAVVYAVLRAYERLRAYVLLGIVQVMLTSALPLWFVVVNRAGVDGWFSASAIGAVLVLAIGLATAGHRFRFDIDLRYIGGALAFGVPMVPHALSHWGLALSDRVVLGALTSTAEAGVYHVAYQFGLPIALAAGALAQSTQALYAEASVGRSANALSDLRRLSTYIVLAIGYLGVAVALLGPPLVELFLPAAYAAGSSLIPWIAVGTILYGCYFIPMNSITMLAGRNRWVWVITAGAATTNLVLNVLLIPTFGATAAAVDTAAGYGLLLLGVFWYARRVAPDGPSYELSRIALGVGILLLPLLLLVVPSAPLIALGIRVASMIAVGAALFAIGLFPRSILRFGFDGMRAPSGAGPRL